jgi:hypothetical protein
VYNYLQRTGGLVPQRGWVAVEELPFLLVAQYTIQWTLFLTGVSPGVLSNLVLEHPLRKKILFSSRYYLKVI